MSDSLAKLCCKAPRICTLLEDTERRIPGTHRRVIVRSESRDECDNCGRIRWLHPDKVDAVFKNTTEREAARRIRDRG